MADFREAAGVLALAKETQGGKGAKIAVLDSGAPFFASPMERKLCPLDVFGHATAISTILFGYKDIIGVCEGATPVYIKVLDDDGTGSVKSVSKGIYEAIERKVDLINLSLGFFRSEKCPEVLEKACKAAYAAGISVICAAGNDGGPVNWPAALKTTISVGSTDKKGEKLAFSCSGEVDFVTNSLNLPVYWADGRKKCQSGTSLGAAVVSGVAALLVSRLKKSVLGIGPDAVKAALRGLAIDLGPKGWDADTGYGFINAPMGAIGDPTVDLETDGSICDILFNKISGLFRKWSSKLKELVKWAA